MFKSKLMTFSIYHIYRKTFLSDYYGDSEVSDISKESEESKDAVK